MRLNKHIALAILAVCWGASHAQPAAAANYTVTYLVSDQAGAAHKDVKLRNAWGLAFLPNDVFWVADNKTGYATLYDGAGATGGSPVKIALPPLPRRPDLANVAAPTGMVSHTGDGFPVDGFAIYPARFIFNSEDGTIIGWWEGSGPNATVQVDNSLNGANCKPVPKPNCQGAVYKGLALGTSKTHGELLYATNFRSGQVEVYDNQWQPLNLGANAFKDSMIPAGYAPYNIVNLGGKLYVTYGKQDAAKHDSVSCRGCGYVNIFNTDGRLLKRLIGASNKAALNAPYGVALAGNRFFPGGAILVGNFGDGHINAYDTDGTFLGALKDKATRRAVVLSGLWAIMFTGANGPPKSSPTRLYFTSGANDEVNGRFGTLTLAP